MGKAISGWSIRLRTWCSVDYCTSEVFTAVKTRNPFELRHLLGRGLASPFERDEDMFICFILLGLTRSSGST